MTPLLFRFRKLAGGCRRTALLFLVSMLLTVVFSPASSALAQTPSNIPGRAYLFRGLIGLVFSRGMDRLAERIRLAGVTASVSAFTSCRSVAGQAIRDYRRDPMPITLIGHSMGGRCTLIFAELLRMQNIPVSLVITFDPARSSPHIPFNVERYINVFKSNDILGAGDIPYRQGFPGHYSSVNLAEHGDIVHINIEKVEVIHKQIIAKVLDISATPAEPEGEIFPIRYRVPSDAPIELWDSGVPVTARAGDTLTIIAAARNVPVWSLVQINRLAENTPLPRGQRVVVPRHIGSSDSMSTGAVPKQKPAGR